jgi:hypothetical protein
MVLTGGLPGGRLSAAAVDDVAQVIVVLRSLCPVDDVRRLPGPNDRRSVLVPVLDVVTDVAERPMKWTLEEEPA